MRSALLCLGAGLALTTAFLSTPCRSTPLATHASGEGCVEISLPIPEGLTGAPAVLHVRFDRPKQISRGLAARG